MKELFKISQIIARQLEGTNSPSDKEYLNRWLSQSASNQRLYDELTDDRVRQAALLEMDTYNQTKKDVKQQLNRIYNKGNQSSQPVRVLRMALAAAAVTILIALSVWIALNQTSAPQQINQQLVMAIPAGSPKAVLTTSAGERIDIGMDVSNFVIVDQSIGQKITKEGDILSYFNAESQVSGSAYADGREMPFNVLEVPVRGEYNLVLSDGTKVFLNAESKIKYPVRFTADERQVEVEGEVFFEVQHNPQWPFIVKDARGNATQVLGTRFNVRSYPDEVVNEVTLVDGAVVFKSVYGQSCELQPGKAAVFNSETRSVRVEEVDLDEVLGWKTGRFIFNDEPLHEILYALSRWYGIEITYTSEAIENVRFSVDFKRSKDLSVLLKSFEMTESISFEFNQTDNRLLVKGK